MRKSKMIVLDNDFAGRIILASKMNKKRNQIKKET